MGNPNYWDFDFTVEYSDNNLWKSSTSRFHCHKVYEIYYLIDNEIISCIGDRLYHLKPGSIVVIPPDVIHTTNSINDNIRKRILIYLPESFIKDFLLLENDLLTSFPKEPFIISGAKRKTIEELFFKLLNEYEKASPSVVLEKSILGELIVSLKRIALGTANTKDITNIQYDKKSPISKMIRYIGMHYDENISLNSLSELFFLNPTYISRAFKEQLGISFSQYLKYVRTREVSSLLRNTDDDMTTIASKTGFSNVTTLCRAFKSSVGTTPLQYRKNHNKTDIDL